MKKLTHGRLTQVKVIKSRYAQEQWRRSTQIFFLGIVSCGEILHHPDVIENMPTNKRAK